MIITIMKVMKMIEEKREEEFSDKTIGNNLKERFI